MRSLSIAATGMQAQQTNVEVISNNIANMNTTAYTRRRAEFNDLLYQNLRRQGAATSDAGTVVPAGVQLGLGVRTAAVYRITEQGNLTNTDNTLDLAIEGKGYFQITLPSGETAYMSSTGQIVTNDGYTVQPGVTIPNNSTSITINASGEVWAKLDGQTTQTNVGTLQIATFVNEAGMEAVGDNLFMETTASGTPTTGTPDSTGFGSILQGYLETENVNVVTEITSLISAQRAYEMNSKVIQTSDEMLNTVTSMK